jgi:hypothetical protein
MAEIIPFPTPSFSPRANSVAPIAGAGRPTLPSSARARAYDLMTDLRRRLNLVFRINGLPGDEVVLLKCIEMVRDAVVIAEIHVGFQLLRSVHARIALQAEAFEITRDDAGRTVIHFPLVASAGEISGLLQQAAEAERMRNSLS